MSQLRRKTSRFKDRAELLDYLLEVGSVTSETLDSGSTPAVSARTSVAVSLRGRARLSRGGTAGKRAARLNGNFATVASILFQSTRGP